MPSIRSSKLAPLPERHIQLMQHLSRGLVKPLSDLRGRMLAANYRGAVGKFVGREQDPFFTRRRVAEAHHIV